MNFQVESQSVTVNIADHGQLLSSVATRLGNGQGFALATINLDHLVKLRHSARFRTAYAEQDLIAADGNPVVWLSRLAGRSVQLVPGSDVLVPLAAVAARVGVTVALVGSTEGTLRAAAAALLRAVPGLNIALCVSPPMGFDVDGAEADALLADLARRKIGLCFLALGAPKQEIFAARGRHLAPGVGFASIGAGLDFLAGTEIRAPMLMRKLSLEWVWRMMQNPTRMIPRYLACAALLPELIADALRLRHTSKGFRRRA